MESIFSVGRKPSSKMLKLFSELQHPNIQLKLAFPEAAATNTVASRVAGLVA